MPIIEGDTGHIEAHEALIDSTSLGSLGAAETITLTSRHGELQYGTLDANTTITMPDNTDRGDFTLALTQDATGSRTVSITGVTWFPNEAYVGGHAAATIATLYFETPGGGVAWRGSWATNEKVPLPPVGVAVGDETTTITTGTAKTTFRMPYAMQVTAVRASLTTASSSGTPTFDINEGGTTILSTKLTVDASEKTSTTAASAAVISDANLADDAEITVDIDVAGTGAKGPKIWLIGVKP